MEKLENWKEKKKCLFLNFFFGFEQKISIKK